MLEPASELPNAPYTPPGGGWRLAAKPAGHILLALAFANTPAPEGARNAGPRRWLLIGEGRCDDLAERERTLGLALIDLSHARERLKLSGPGAAAQLATGTALDLKALSEGASAQTLFGPLAIHLTRMGPQLYEILIARSFAKSLWRALTHT